jgi:hypothetical protein
MQNVHIGQIIRQIIIEKGIQYKTVARDMSMTTQGLRNALDKKELHQELIERFMKVLDVNLYEYLARKWENPAYKTPQEKYVDEVKEQILNYEKTPGKPGIPGTSSISLLINVDESKKNDVLSLIFG